MPPKIEEYFQGCLVLRHFKCLSGFFYNFWKNRISGGFFEYFKQRWYIYGCMKKTNFKAANKNNNSSSRKPPSSGGGNPNGGKSSAGRNNPQRGDRSEAIIPKDLRIVIGTHAVNEVLAVRPKSVKNMWLRTGWESSGDLKDIQALAKKHDIKIEERSEQALEKFGPSQQGAALFVSGAPEFIMKKMGKKLTSIVLMLDGIEDPHNLGAILRTSWLIGVEGVMIPRERAVGLTPTTHKVACGGVEHVPVELATNFSQPIETLKEKGYWVYGLSPRGTKSLYDLNLPEKVVWAVGSEDKGMRVTTEKLCDELVYLPQASSSASYNASVATAMALSETLRQHAAHNQKKT